MSGPEPIRRVAMLKAPMGAEAYARAMGVIEYGDRAAGWQFVGKGNSPFVESGRLDAFTFDGLIGEFNDGMMVDEALTSGAAVVNTSTVCEGLGMTYVCNDDEATGRLAAEHLLERGFAELGFFGDDDEWLSRRRGDGFDRVVRAADRICHVRTFRSSGGANIRALVRQWLEELPKPIGLMAHRDYLARVTVNEATKLGLGVPDDVAVIGAHNNRFATLLAARSVSSVELDWRRIGYLAAEALDALMAGGEPPRPRFVPPLGVVTRQSTDITLVEDELVNRALTYIRDHCVDGIDVEDVLEYIQVSRRHLEVRMKAAIGITPRVAITRERVERAKRMLVTDNTPIEAIARSCGFRQTPRLTEAFKRLTGLTPGNYRHRHARW
jgi:LacI family transcriptional regulator